MKKTQFGFIGLTIALLAGSSIVAISTASESKGAKKTVVHSVAWLNSFEDALVQSKKSGKPILLLSMFGKLDEELPCANARTLRATLFKDPAFRELAAKEVVLAWEMVRAVPKVEIDLGDGKKIKRSLRGNAVMYLCNSDGKVIDAFPGIYTKEDFFPMIRESIKTNFNSTEANVVAWHKEWAAKPSKRMIRLTMSKSASESTTLYALGARPNPGVAVTYPKGATPEQIAFINSARGLSDMSLTPMTAESVAMETLGKTLGQLNPEEAGWAILKADSSRNVDVVRRVIHLWLASEPFLPTPESGRDAVLETILKIPYKDPYFGLRDIVIPGTPN